jgi:hypothetical protein
MAITKATASSVAPAAKGDLVVGSGTNDAAVLAVGSADQVLTVDSSTSTGLKWAAAAGGTSLPAFSVKKNATQSITAGVYTKVTWQTEVFDTDGKFASDRFTPTVAGYYQINASIGGASNSASSDVYVFIYKNGTIYNQGGVTDMPYGIGSVSTVIYLDTDDYVEVYANVDPTQNIALDEYTFFSGAGIRS